jgi:hypothetical protein
MTGCARAARAYVTNRDWDVQIIHHGYLCEEMLTLHPASKLQNGAYDGSISIGEPEHRLDWALIEKRWLQLMLGLDYGDAHVLGM